MGKQRKLVNKLTRLDKFVKQLSRVDTDKINKKEEILAGSPKAYKAIKESERRIDRNFGYDAVSAQKPRFSIDLNGLTLERFDFGTLDFGMKLTLAAGMVEATGILAGDLIQIREGSLKGQYLTVVAEVDSTHLRLEDVASFGSAENNVSCRAIISSMEKGKK